MCSPGAGTRRVGLYFRVDLAMFVRMITASRFLFGSGRNKPHKKTADFCSGRLVRAEVGGVLHFLGARDSALSAILRHR